jgi:hypothetical protein
MHNSHSTDLALISRTWCHAVTCPAAAAAEARQFLRFPAAVWGPCLVQCSCLSLCRPAMAYQSRQQKVLPPLTGWKPPSIFVMIRAQLVLLLQQYSLAVQVRDLQQRNTSLGRFFATNGINILPYVRTLSVQRSQGISSHLERQIIEKEAFVVRAVKCHCSLMGHALHSAQLPRTALTAQTVTRLAWFDGPREPLGLAESSACPRDDSKI